jgi:uncharacterized delta-60 repeat protein
MLAFALVAVGVVVTGSALATRGYGPLAGLRAAAGHRHGSLDTSFGGTGEVTGTIDSGGAAASALAIQKDGKLVAAGHSNTGPFSLPGSSAGNNDFALVRYHANGTLDTSFGRGGKVTTTIGPGGGLSIGGPHAGGAVASALAIQKDGKLVAAGGTHHGFGGEFALARYNANGTLDTSFGRGGIVKTPTGSASALAIQQDGKLVAAGGAVLPKPGSDSGFALARYHANGRLDTSFGRGGKVTTPFGSGNDFANELAIQKDGKLVAAGVSDNGFALARYHANGTLDTSFGRGGKVTTPIGPGAGASALAIQQDGKLVAAGGSDNGHVGVFTLARYNANGTLDTSFGRGGKVTTPIGPGAGASALAIQQDGKLVVVGGRSTRREGRPVPLPSGDTFFVLVRYNANGTLDTSLGRSGKVTTLITNCLQDCGASALAIQQDGKLVAAGGGYHGSGGYPEDARLSFALVRYWP